MEKRYILEMLIMNNDKKRRDLYRARHNYEKIEGTPGWFSWFILW